MVGVGLCSTRGTLAVSQGFSGRAMLAPTMELQTNDIIFMKIMPFACRGLHCRPANGAGRILGFAAAANAGGAKPRPYGGITK